VTVQLPSIDLDGYRICLFRAPRFLSVFHTSLSLAFGAYVYYVGDGFCKLKWILTDLTAFVIVLIRTRASKTHRCDSKIPSILDTITRDAAVYFSVIFTSHFLFLIMLVFVRVRMIRSMFSIPLFSPTTPPRKRYGPCQLCKFRSHAVVLTPVDALPLHVPQWKCSVSSQQIPVYP